jgi:predicted transcriptional regulator
VRHGSKLTYEELQEHAHTLAREAGDTYAEIAEALGVSENAVAKAVTTAGPKFQQVQMRIIEHLSEYEVEREETVRFRTWRKGQGRG